MTSQSSLLGAAGEHFVMSELLRRGFIAALAPQGVPNTDIVVTDLEGHRLCSIQVKTRRHLGSDGGWHMKSKHEKILGDSLFYCFVDFGKTTSDRPQLFILPSATIAEILKQTHIYWLNKPGKKGQAHKDTVMRRLLPDYSRLYGEDPTPYKAGWLEAYRDVWHLLKLDPVDPSKVDDDEADENQT
ncbi:MAG: hypothetical protein AB7H77_11000 [Bdellovibrionales bacterium]